MWRRQILDVGTSTETAKSGKRLKKGQQVLGEVDSVVTTTSKAARSQPSDLQCAPALDR